MSSISIFSGSFCREETILREIRETASYRAIGDREVVAEAALLSGMPEGKIEKSFSAKASVFNKFTHEKERSIAYLKLALAEMLLKGDIILSGFTGLLVPREVSHVLRVCLIADTKFRLSEAEKEQGLPEREALKIIHRQDGDRAAWVNGILGLEDPWDPSIYDLVIPVDKVTIREGVDLIMENFGKGVVRRTPASQKAADDFLLSARIEVALAREGHDVGVSVADGAATLTINKHVLLLSRLEEDLRAIVEKVPGVRHVETKVGKGYYQADIYRRYDFEMPSKVLLVDDEREFVQTLSERLLMRDMGSAVAYDGESALDFVKEEEPEVMILDLKMPGIDGIEVLRQVKKTRPEIEVVILTGHGSEADREVCMGLGAFAYLQKPVDIDVLSETLKKANDQMRRNIERKKAAKR